MDTTDSKFSVQTSEQVDNSENVEATRVNAPDSSVDFSEEDALFNIADSDDLSLGEMSDDEHENNFMSLTPEALLNKNEEEIIAVFSELLSSKDIQNLRRDVELLKVAFYKSRRASVDTARKEYIEINSTDEGFIFDGTANETIFKELFARYRNARDEFNSRQDSEKESNYAEKLKIIEELKELQNSSETINHTFAAFRDLQNRWKESGSVPKSNVKDLWENYHIQVENFYNFIKINKELRDLDLKKNYEAKLEICEDAEALLLEPSVVVMFQSLQKLHDAWREIGPVAIEYKEQLWERFKSVSTKINKIHQDHFETIKQEQVKNLQLKTELCERVQSLIDAPKSVRKEWEDASEKLIEIQKVWKTIGFAPKKDNNAVYARFRALCDAFFNAKGEFYASFKNELQNNLEAKIMLCVHAEAIAESNEWKKGTEDLLLFQKQWKEIGAVPRKSSDAVWKRFREACTKFFERKSEFYTGLDAKYEDNLKNKQVIIESLRNFNVNENSDSFDKLKAFQKEWTEAGFVPMKYKDSIQNEYRTLIDEKFAELRSSGKDRKIDRFKQHISEIKSSDRNVRNERDKILSKIESIKSDITLWENNIGFFAKSKNAQGMIDNVNAKIERAKRDIEVLKEQIRIIDEQ